jgi:hypothetical protein
MKKIPYPRRAWKAFCVEIDEDTGKLTLRSPIERHPWHPEEGIGWRAAPAACKARPLQPLPHKVPVPDCQCGIYASYDVEEALLYGALLGVVRPIGRTIPAAEGWRAEGAVCELLTVPDKFKEEISYLPDQLRQRLVPWEIAAKEVEVPLPSDCEVS